MRPYAKASPRMWNGMTGKAIRGEKPTQLLYSYLITCPHANMIGLYHLPVAYIQADLGLSVREVRAALERLRGLGFLLYDFVTERIWVIEHWRHELGSDDLSRGENGRWDNRGLRAAEQLKGHVGSELARLFLDRYPKTREFVASLIGEGSLASPVEDGGAPSEPLTSPFEDPSGGLARDARVSGAGTGAGTGAGERGERAPSGAPHGSANGRPEIPPELAAAIPDFPTMWAERMKTPGRNKRPTPSAEGHQLAQLVKLLASRGSEAVIACVAAATHGGYQGLPLDRFTNAGGARPMRPGQRVSPQATDEDRERRARRIQRHE